MHLTTSPQRAPKVTRELSRALDASLFKALGDPTRLHLLTCLAGCCRACSVSEVAACCEVDKSVVSRHLSQLEEAGVLVSRREGKRTLYSVAYGPLSGALARLSEAVSACDPAERNREGRGKGKRCSGVCCCSTEGCC